MYNEINSAKIDLNSEPPVGEPDRQYYFMAKAQKYVTLESDRLKRPLFAAVKTFGCQMNARDSEKISGILESIGYILTEEEEADLVVYNTCTVRENANNKIYGRLGYLNGYKKKNPCMKIALCGCMMQEKEPVNKITRSYPFVDIIFGTHNFYKFAELLVQSFETGRPVVDIWEDSGKIVEKLPTVRKFPFKSGVNIMFGCNNFCSYCIVPYVRGRERSRKPEEILSEIRSLAADGVVEIMLLGQNVNSYGKTFDPPVSFAELLKEVEKTDGIERIRFMTSHPKDLSDELIEVMKHSAKICRHLHLPVQSGSTRLLEKMNRKYTKEDYLNLVDKIRKAIPDIAITTDIIVGFPGETEQDFEETMDVVRKVGYDSAFTFIYSKRTGTPAAKYEDQVPEDVVKDRFDRLLKEVQTIATDKSMQLEGKVEKVLFEHKNEQDETLMTGRLSNNSIVHVKGSPELIGQIRDVKLTECKGFYYLGELYEHA